MPEGFRVKDFDKEVYEIVSAVPMGSVATYGLIAVLLGKPQLSRRVGQALMNAPEGLPCHRIVNSQGRLVPGWTQQKELLVSEGITFKDNGYVDIKKHLWK